MATNITSVLRDLLKQYRLNESFTVAKMPDYWTSVVGEKVAGMCVIRSFQQGTLTITVSNSVWRSELQLRREELRSKMNALIGSETIREIVIR
jgi:predicted nucleic acid-binding Zn ribbon protein